jgi:hypothetical protein
VTAEPRRDPAWLRVLDRHGLPTLYALGAAALLVWQLRDARTERRELLTKLDATIGQQTAVLRDLAAKEQLHADAVSATWPAIRLRVASAPREPAAPGGNP